MALAQPTGLKVQELTAFATIEQDVTRENDGGVFATLEQRTGLLRVNEGGVFASLRQTVTRANAGGVFATLEQSVTRQNDGGTFAELRQLVYTPLTARQSPTRITLGGQDITDTCGREWSITASEGSNRTANISIVKVPKGSLNITSYQGQPITISRLQNGSLVPLFIGYVERPVYSRYPATISLLCTDLRNERVGKHDRAQLKVMTGGIFSNITQRDDATGKAWVNELMRTVSGSLDYTSEGVLRYRPWELGTARYTLTEPDIHYVEASSEFATRSEIINKVSATLEYRYFRRNAIAHAVSLDTPRSRYCTGLFGCTPARQVEDEDGNLVDQVWPTKAGILQAAQSVSGWMVSSLEYIPIPPDGWYRDSNDVTRKIAFGATDARRQISAMGADIELERYISQPKRETYNLAFTAPESIDQFGEVEGQDMRFATETRIDGSIYEERGCSVIANPDDRRADVNLAMQAIQAMAQKTVKGSHRKNYIGVRYKPENGSTNERNVLPIDIGDVVISNTTELNGTGFVTEFKHRETEDGDVWTDIKLAVSRVDSDVSVTEDWSLPAAPGTYKLTPPAPGQLESPDCPAPVGEVSVEGTSRIEPDGTVIIVAPAVDRSQVDEITGTRQHTYSVQIPKNPLSVEVI